MSDLTDRLLDTTVIGGFSRIGSTVRGIHRRPVATRMDGRTVLVTGATGGLGRATAVQLARLGADLVVVGRDPAKLSDLEEAVEGPGEVRVEQADLSLMSEVAALADRLAGSLTRLDVLVNNVGVLLTERRITAEGLEATYATNLLGQYLLTERLLPLLASSSPSRVVTVSSGGMYTAKLDPDHIDPVGGPYRGSAAYAHTKRAQVILSEVWAERHGRAGVVSHSMHPGWADTPGVEGSLPAFRTITRAILRTPDEGADTIVWLAADPEPAASNGRFWHDRRPRPTHRLRRTVEEPGDRDRLLERLELDADRLAPTIRR
ncbi:MAG: SDR family NAD(P)-dependent oxidoreductase [Acidimicrobiia bacterium]